VDSLTPSVSIDNELLTILNKMNTIGKTFIVGGHLRNLYYQYEETDVDFITMLTVDELKSIFTRITFTDRGLDFGVCRTIYKNRQFDFSFCINEEEFHKKLIKRDFTVNSLYSDGNTIFFPGDSKQHLDEKLLVPCYSLDEHFIQSETTLIRTYRLISEFGFSCSDEVLMFLNSHKDKLTKLELSIRTNEFHRIVKGPFALKSFFYLWTVYFPSLSNHFLYDKKELFVKTIGDSIKGRLVYLDSLSKESYALNILKIFNLNEIILIDFEEHRFYLKNESEIPREQFSFYLLIKRYQTNDDPIELTKFLKTIKK